MQNELRTDATALLERANQQTAQSRGTRQLVARTPAVFGITQAPAVIKDSHPGTPGFR
jgi:hypothetical protein